MQEAQDWQNRYDALKADHDMLLAQRKVKAQGSPEQDAAPDANGDAGMPSSHQGQQTAQDPDGDGVHGTHHHREGPSPSPQHIAELQVCTQTTEAWDSCGLYSHLFQNTSIFNVILGLLGRILSTDVHAQAELEHLRVANAAAEVSCWSCADSHSFMASSMRLFECYAASHFKPKDIVLIKRQGLQIPEPVDTAGAQCGARGEC